MSSTHDVNKCMCLQIAAGNYSEVFEGLIEGTITSTYSNCGHTPISVAAMYGQEEILRLLIMACTEPDSEIFKRKKKINPNEDEMDSTPEGMDKLEWVDEFEMFRPTEDSTEQQESLYLYYAKTFERTGPIINSIEDLNHNCNYHDGSDVDSQARRALKDPHTLDKNLNTPLHHAAKGGHMECAKILMAKGAKVDAVNKDGYTALHFGVIHPVVTRFLLRSGANPNLKTIDTGETPFHIAARNKCIPACHSLIEAHANLNLTDNNEQTPLMCAIISGIDEIALRLIESGAGKNFEDNNGCTALYYAVIGEQHKVVKRLIKRGVRNITSHYLLHYSIENDMPQMVEALIINSDDLNIRNSEGDTPIMVAIQHRRLEILEFLLKLGRESTFVDPVGQNEIILALQFCSNVAEFEPIARLMLTYSRDTCWMTTTSFSVTSSQYSMYLCYSPYCHNALARAILSHKLDIAEFLIKEGFDLTDICKEHVLNSLRSMTASGCYELARLLVHSGFTYPYKPLPFPKDWPPTRRLFEEDMRQLCSTPLSLKSQTRIFIRRHLSCTLSRSESAKLKYHATKQESALSRMIKELEIPKVLKTYLIDFDDCPTVMKPKYETVPRVQEIPVHAFLD